MLWRRSWRPHQRKQHIGSRYARDRMLRRGLGLRHGQKAHSGTYEAHQRPSVGLRWGRRTRDNHSSPHRGWESDRSISTALPLKVNAVLRAMTNEPAMRDRSVVRLSVTPSTK